MKIIELTYNFPCEIFINRHLNSLLDYDCEIQLIARHSEDKFLKSASIDLGSLNEIGYKIAPQFDHLTTLEKILSLKYLIYSRKIKRGYSIRDRVMLGYFKKLEPDIIHFHFGSLAVLMDWLPHTLGIPYTISLRGSDVQVNTISSESYPQELKRSILESAGVHSVCNAVWEKASKICQVDQAKVYHRTIFTTVPIKGKPREQNQNLSKEEIAHFVAIGRFTWHKAYINLLIAFRNYLDHVGPAKLTIIGDGPDRESLLYWIKDLELIEKVSLPGKLPYEKFYEILVNCHALIQSSIAEGFSNVTAEAMGMGVPVFATDVGGTGEIIKDGENGFLLDPHDPQNWWGKLRFVEDKSLMKKIGRVGWLTAKETFSEESHAKDFIEFYQDVLGGQ